MKKIFYILTSLFFLFSFPNKVLSNENNIFGIHLAQPHYEELVSASKLVNANGGDWGYVTLVIQENDRDINKWQDIFNQLRRLHLIPIIRLATEPEGSFWKRPKKESAEVWANFLDSFLWPVKERYIILFNEPNHASEWGGSVDAINYGEVAYVFSKTLKEKNSDFVIMLAGLDSASPSSKPFYEDEYFFLKTLINSNPNIFKYIDAWSSHSYPNPNFSASPYKRGRNSITNYDWELSVLRELGVNKELPVFITETGWERKSGNWEEEKNVAYNFMYSFEDVWKLDKRVKAVTPFVLDYQSGPFLGFSWKKQGIDEYYEQYREVQDTPKIKGEPFQYEKMNISTSLPKVLTVGSTYSFIFDVKNIGQAVWDEKWGYELKVSSVNNEPSPFSYFIDDFNGIEPKEEQSLNMFLKTGKESGNYSFNIDLYKDKNKLLDGVVWNVEIVPQPSLEINASSFPKIKTKGQDFELQIFNEREELVYKKQNIEIKDSKGKIDAISNITFGEKYRLVILRPYYLPRQIYFVFNKNSNKADFRPLLPFDFNADGKLSFMDIIGFFRNLRLIKLFMP